MKNINTVLLAVIAGSLLVIAANPLLAPIYEEWTANREREKKEQAKKAEAIAYCSPEGRLKRAKVMRMIRVDLASMSPGAEALTIEEILYGMPSPEMCLKGRYPGLTPPKEWG